MAINLSGEWTLSVAGKEASFDQRIIISGSSNGQDGTYPWSEFGTKTVQGDFGIQVQYEKGDAWHNSLMRVPNVTRAGNQVTLRIESDDNVGVGDLDFDDLVLTAETTVQDDDYCVWGQIRAYSGCIFNPCNLPRLVIDDWIYVAERLNPRIRDILEPLVTEVPPVVKPPFPDPPPWQHRAIRFEVPDDVAQELVLGARSKIRRGAFRMAGSQLLSHTSDETVGAAETTDAVAMQGFLGSASIARDLIRRLRCHVTHAPGVNLRIIDYDPAPGESPSGPFLGTGPRETLGQVVTDDWGFYFFCFHWTYPHIGGLKPDIMLQLVRFDPEGDPYVAMESDLDWNIDRIHRKDWCIPAHLVDPATPDVFDPGRVWQYIGNLPVVRISTAATAALGRGLANSVPGDGTATYPLTLHNAPFGGTLLLKASFQNFPQVGWYKIRYRTTDNPEGNTGWVDLSTPLRYLDATWTWQDVGPVPATIEGVATNAYPNLEGSHNYSHPHGLQYKAYIGTGFIRTGFLHLEIRGYDSGGNLVAGTFDSVTLRIDNIAPLVEIVPITAGGAACGFVTIAAPNERIPVTYRVIDYEGHLRNYRFKLFKCHNNLIGGSDQYSTHYDPATGIHWAGTPDEAALGPDFQGYVTRDLPQVGDFFTAAEAATRPNFAAVSIELWASSRTTNGIRSSIHHPRYVEVIGIKLD